MKQPTDKPFDIHREKMESYFLWLQKLKSIQWMHFLSSSLFPCFFLLFFSSLLKESLALESLKEKTSTKALGMGNAYSSAVNDADAFFYNPAQIANFRKIRWTVANLNIGSSYSLISNLRSAANLRSLDSKEEFSNFITRFYSSSFESHARGRMSLEMPYFMFMVSMDGIAHFIPMDPPFPILDTSFYVDTTYGIGVGFPISPHIDIGGVFKRVRRDGITGEIGPEWIASLNLNTIEKELRKTGSAYIFDIAARFNVDAYASPAFSIIWKNPLNTKFKSQHKELQAPLGYESELIVGAGFNFDLPAVKIKPALDIKHILNTDLQWGKKIHLGVQLEAPFITLRTGLNQGYLTLGGSVYLLFGLIQIDGAYYSQELGEYTGQFGEKRIEFNIKLAVSSGELAMKPFKKGGKIFSRGLKKIWRKLKKRRY